MKKLFLPVLFIIVSINLFAQNTGFNLYFTAFNDQDYIQMDSIKIKNLTQNCDTVLYYPDTTLSLDSYTTINEQRQISQDNFEIYQNSPNPFNDVTSINVKLFHTEIIQLNISNLFGQQLISFHQELHKGYHSFTFYSGNEKVYLLTISAKNQTRTIKMISNGLNPKMDCSLKYSEFIPVHDQYKSATNFNNFTFNPGDELMYIGYSNFIESGLINAPSESQLIEFQYATNIPCPNLPSFVYGGQEYNTIQVFSQCWMKESLNLETENSWCVYNSPEYCDEYGRLYLWETTLDICPEGWHLPSDDDWRILEGVTDSHHLIEDPIWDYSGGWRGFDTGTNLKSTDGWIYGGNGTDLFGFTAKPGGYQLPNGNNGAATIEVGFWTSTEYENDFAWHRFLQFSKIGVYRYPFEKEWGLYVRCLKD